jgi:hypothetical protein
MSNVPIPNLSPQIQVPSILFPLLAKIGLLASFKTLVVSPFFSAPAFLSLTPSIQVLLRLYDDVHSLP